MRWFYQYRDFKLIMSHIEYLIQTFYVLVLNLESKVMKNLALMAGFNVNLMMIRDSGLLFWATLYGAASRICRLVGAVRHRQGRRSA